jgi:hypothetical protein
LAVPRLTGPNWPSFYRRIEPGDMLIVTRLDRLVRSTRDLLNVIAALADRVCHARGAGRSRSRRPTVPHDFPIAYAATNVKICRQDMARLTGYILHPSVLEPRREL